MENQFYKNVKIVRGQTLPETALTKSTANFPATTYIDVSGYEFVDVLVHLGTLANALTIMLKQNTASTGGTLDTINATSCKKVTTNTDDGQVVIFNLETQKLTANHHYLACQITGAGSTADYADVLFMLHGARHLPVSQATATIPTDNALTFAG